LLDPAERLLRPPIEVLVLVSVRLYRDGIAEAVGRDSRFRVVGNAATLDDAREQLDALPRPPSAALVDLGLAEGVGAVRALRDAWPRLAVVALGVREADRDVVSMAEAGVAGLVSRDATLAELLDAIEAAAREEALCSPAVTAVLLRRVASYAGHEAPTEEPALTRREREVIVLIGKGLTNKEIAGSLRIELPTVKNHVHNILEKLRVNRRTDAVAAARARGELNRI
jgi:two-component system nitrate/nitrite response regulator NarL